LRNVLLSVFTLGDGQCRQELSRIETAKFLEKKLRQKGLPARMDVDLKDGKLLYVVYIGSYKFYNKAQRELHRVRRIVSDAFITPVR